jgi:enamine deaminase RidA (YjgF/YER057c/UK114 family)
MSASSASDQAAVRHRVLAENIRASIFSTPEGLDEIFLVVRSRMRDRFEKAISDLRLDYDWALRELGAEGSQLAFARLYLSDIVNQLPALEVAGFPPSGSSPFSLVEQRPLLDDEMVLLAYHLGGGPVNVDTLAHDGRKQVNRFRTRNYDLLWGANLCHSSSLDSFDQTAGIFEEYNRILNSAGMTMLDSSLRTWIYVRDIDNHYSGMVEARKGYFETHGLNRDTRYIASTGIEAKLATPPLLVSMDFLNIHPLQAGQIVRMEALDHLGPTIDYGVTFERGTKVVFGDRCHLYISGTASIDPSGQVLFPQDAGKQTVRALENISALLKAEGCDFRDVAYFLAYARNPVDHERILAGLKAVIPPEIPLVFVEGAVCRPTWLVEVECVALKRESNPFPPFC